ncbi:MAG: choice-of-anchor Q domain-containing protein, partial [Aquihabitans sp.]
MTTADDGPVPGGIYGRAAVRQTIAVAWGTWARSAVVVAAITAIFLVVVLVAMGVLSDVARLQADNVVRDGQVTLRGIMTLVLQVAVPTLVIGLLLTALIMAALVSLADDHLAGSRSTIGSGLARGLRRAPAAFGAMALAVGGVLLAIVVTPLLMIVGMLALLLTPLARLVSRRSTRLGWWPSARALALLIVPLAPGLVLAARWALVLPAASLELRGPVQALARSRSLMAGRSVRAVPLLVFGVAAYLGAQFVVVQAGALAGLEDLAVALRLTVQLVVIAVPVAMVAVVFRQLAGPTEDHLIVPTPAPRVPTRTLAVTMLLAVSLTAGVLVVSQVVRAEPAAAEGSVSFTVTSLSDEPDATPGDAQCLTAGGVCSLRAAIEESNGGPATDLQVVLATTGTIRLASPLEITTDFSLDGGATGLSLSGRPCDGCDPGTALLRFTNAATTFNLRNLTLDGGLAGPDGGGAIETVATGALQNVTLTQNRSDAAPGAAIAVLGGALEIENATFANNLAASGADLAVLHGTASVSQSTFVDASGSAVHSEEVGQLTIYKSILSSQNAVVCSGAQLNGGLNLSSDPACRSESSARGLQPLADNGGPVFTVGLSSESNAVDAGSQESCAATDARGVARPQGLACDIGAFELEVPTGPTFTVDDLGDATDADPGDGLCHTTTGVCTLRAAAEELNTLHGDPARIQFGLPGTVAVASPIALAAQMVVTGNGHQVVLDGVGRTRILETLTPGVAIELDHLTLANGFTDDAEGGAALRSTGDVTTESMTFRNNVSTAAPGGAVAVGGDRVSLTNATFWENVAPSGADVWQHSWGQAMLTNVTLARGASGSLQSDLGEMYLFNSIVVPAAGAPCAGTGSYVAMQVLNPLGAGQCPQSISIVDNAEIGIGTLGQRGGSVPTVNITAASAAIDRVLPGSGTCPATDARGVARDPQACDVGSFELASVPNATVVVTADPPSPAQGQAISLTA